MRIRLETLGCRLNEAEIQRWAREFQALGHSPGASGQDTDRALEQPVDLVVVNTCAVTQEAVRKSRQLLRRVQRQNPRARLIVSGCATALDETGLAATGLDHSGIDLLIGNADKDRLVEIAARELALPIMPATAETSQANPLFARGRQRAFVKIQDGCRHQCTFCVTTIARGPERSRPLADIVAEIQEAAAEGIQEAVLTGVHATGYGADLGCRLEDLIAAVLRDTDIPRLRLGSIEPWGLSEGFWHLFENPRLAPHLHLPLQSGSDRILKRMGRRCDSATYRALIAQARQGITDFNPTTDIIVGFPGESESDWEQTLNAVTENGFGHVHIFSYSPRPGTRAAGMDGQVSAEVKRARTRELNQLAAQLKKATLQANLGRTLPVLFESGLAKAGGAPPCGYTPNYLPVRLESTATPGPRHHDWTNRIAHLTLTGISADGCTLLGMPRAIEARPVNP
ncbi:Threonylcarbamoyladenosine tRNA methylthiotransferase MtaB [Thiorhodovibrio winogradskyi]|uniref:Threonylcarbamoyladenosine tRNA methylthiotransferase MtaB n=1 Tax=Thiorhodovibrio winogradskyi TaxID=77007 RepID=A0ABZ0S5T6_9GAMM|nr:MiaB/RimO family radical SAM methylthiotransferase [Thiorhodovibrio winogradskyi]